MSARMHDIFPPTSTRLRYTLDDIEPVNTVSGTNKFLRIVTSRPTDTAEITALRFDNLVRRWQEETAFMSSPEDICTNEAYQEIIKMGDAVVPYILRELELSPAYWFWALTAITGAVPVPASFQGTFDEAVQLWLDWGRHNGYKW